MISPNFVLSELAQHGGQRRHHTTKRLCYFPFVPYPETWIEPRAKPLFAVLEELRALCGGHPMRIISGFRTDELNTWIGGARFSQHKEGRAADIVVAGVAPNVVHRNAVRLHESGMRIGGIGLYNGFVHIDVRPDRLARWYGSRTAKATALVQV